MLRQRSRPEGKRCFAVEADTNAAMGNDDARRSATPPPVKTRRDDHDDTITNKAGRRTGAQALAPGRMEGVNQFILRGHN